MAGLNLPDQYALSKDGGFIGRVQEAICAAAVSIFNEVLPEIQQLQLSSGTATGGTLTLSFSGSTTAAIAFNATAVTFQTALQAIASIGAGNVVCTGGPFPSSPIVITFAGTLAAIPLNLITIGTNSLTGTSPVPAVTRTQAGVSAVNHAARATFAKLVLNNPSGYASLMAAAVAANATAQGDYPANQGGNWTPNGVNVDADIATAVATIWNCYI